MTPDAHFEIIGSVSPSARLRDGCEWMQVFACTELTIDRLAETELNA